MNLWVVFQFILFAGAVQGLVLGALLWKTSADRKTANRFLALILFFFAYRLGVEVLRSNGIGGVDSIWYHVLLEYNWIYGALIFFYIRSYMDPDFSLTRKDWIHFLPVGLEFLISNFVKTQNFFWDGTRESLCWLGSHAYVLWMHHPTQLIVFSGLIFYYLYRSRQLITHYTLDHTLPVQSEDIHWVEVLLKAYFYFAIGVVGVGLVDYLFFDFAFDPLYRFPVYIAMAILTYWLGLQGFSRRVSSYLQRRAQVPTSPVPNPATSVADLEKVMQAEQLYKNSTLTLAQLAEAIHLKPYQLSQILNQSIQQSFSDYVNSYRVAEVKRLINSPQAEKFTLLSLAFEAGFNSKASFNRVVKKLTGKSPRELKDSK